MEAILFMPPIFPTQVNRQSHVVRPSSGLTATFSPVRGEGTGMGLGKWSTRASGSQVWSVEDPAGDMSAEAE